MLDNQKISAFIGRKRKELGMTQAEVAQQLQISFQAVSKWENGTLPNIEILVELAELLGVSVDEILAGRELHDENFSYRRWYGRKSLQDYSRWLVRQHRFIQNKTFACFQLYPKNGKN